MDFEISISTMSKVAENLERYYRSFIGQERDWHFFLGLADYVRYVSETPETNQIVAGVLKQKSRDHEKLDRLEEDSIREIKGAAETLFFRVRSHNLSIDGLDKKITYYENCVNGHVAGSQSMSHLLFEAIGDIASLLYQNGHKVLVEDYVKPSQYVPNSPGELIFSKSMNLRDEAFHELIEKKRTAIWVAWDDLVFASFVLSQGNSYGKQLHKECMETRGDAKKQWILFSCLGAQGEMEKVEQGDESTMFNKAIYGGHATRFHNYLTGQLEANERPRPPRPMAYLDTCVISGLAKNDIEPTKRQAVLDVLDAHKKGAVKLITSSLTRDEISKIPAEYRTGHEAIYQLLEDIPVTSKINSAKDPLLTSLSLMLEAQDAMHVFEAAKNNVDYFVTLDQRTILKKQKEIFWETKVRAVSPVDLATTLVSS